MDYKIIEPYEMNTHMFGVKGKTIINNAVEPVTLHFTDLAAKQMIDELQHFLKERADAGLDN